jgi:Mg-chelatase subunit ChlD
MKDCTEIVCLIDKSGSMEPLRKDAIGGFNKFLEEQQAHPSEANLTLVLFDTEYTSWPTRPIKQHERLTPSNYVPGGWTALLDALGKAINELGARLSTMPEADRPNKVIFVIITDGQENSSKEFSKEQIKQMVTHQQEKYRWRFLYLGANVDAFAEAGGIGIIRAANFAATHQGVAASYSIASNAVGNYRSTGEVSDNWSSKQ